MRRIPFFQVDAFTDKPFKGNPAAICLPDEELSMETMQAIAAENNLAETAFVVKAAEGFDLRWFTPTVEIDLCGHATLATAHILWEEGILDKSEIASFNTRSGVLTASLSGDWIELNFPASLNNPAILPEEVSKALQAEPVHVVFARDRYIVELEKAEDVVSLKPDFSGLREHEIVIVTSPADEGSPYDFISRTFAPLHGIDEDPVTGSSHCALVPYYAGKYGKNEFFAYQASDRGGELKLRYEGDRVLMSGQAITVITGTFFPGGAA
ncbi:PhzF family phenazine biosynthesis protein [Arcticibacter tournemirensis]|uniref:PhzF family phenazine biosynthesis protein n=1 Tax=Arcticibacter tournemirensis TaxID=699437 RepID=A0A4Q0M944_9SPHI|nr:PhzF family phenazine biosynthesis protein [Arcticibacter tournemirensis]RXF69654.1 PhzF family phenazine biosynthesis protein [Arcticibacter tournemirensis]